MKKISILLITLMVVSVVFLSGCNDDVDDGLPEGMEVTDDPYSQILDGWYYVFDQHSWDDLDFWYNTYNNTLLYQNIDHTLLFFENKTKTMRLKAYKDTPGDIIIGIGNSTRDNPLFSFQASENQLDTGEFVFDYDELKNYFLWSQSGDVYITLLQYYDNCGISWDYHTVDFVRYEGD